MEKAFGKNKRFWGKHHGTKLNAIGLTQSPHKAMDAESGIKLAFLPDLQQCHAKVQETNSREFLVLYHKYGASQLDHDSLFAKTAVEDITEEKGGFFTVKFGGGLCVLVGQKVPKQFFSVCSFFPKKQKEEVKEDIQKKSDVKEVIRESLVEKVFYYKGKLAKGKTKKEIAEKAESGITGGNNLRIMYSFAADLPFYTVRGLEARALRLLGHIDFKDLRNGKHFTGDDFSDEESTEEDKSAPDEDAQKDLLMKTCRDSIALSNLPVQHLHEPPKKKRRC